MRSIRNLLSLIKQAAVMGVETFRDRKRYLRSASWSGARPDLDQIHLEGDIIRKSHVVEKALAMPDFEALRGLKIALSLADDLKIWEQAHPDKLVTFDLGLAAKAVLVEYVERQADFGSELLVSEPDFVRTVRSWVIPERIEGGTDRVKELSDESRASLKSSLMERRSIRVFHPEISLSAAEMERISTIANRAPSVCNRQTGRLHFYQGKQAQEVLKLQNGNRGFGHQVPAVIIVTSDMRYFLGSGERNQPYVDGGLFGMQLLLGLQAEGYGAVPLNWCQPREVDENLRRVAAIPECEAIVMLVGIGKAIPGVKVPVSPRRSPSEVFTNHPKVEA